MRVDLPAAKMTAALFLVFSIFVSSRPVSTWGSACDSALSLALLLDQDMAICTIRLPYLGNNNEFSLEQFIASL